MEKEPRILVTGGSGVVGQHLKNILPDATYVSSKDCDLTNIVHVRWLISSYIPDIVIHLAAKVGGIIDNIENPVGYFDDNILMNTNLVKVCYEQKVTRLIGVLSTCIYPDIADSYPMKEEDLFSGAPTQTNFSYGYAKRCLAVQVNAYNQQYGTKWNYLIPCNLYSEYDNFDNENKMHFITALLNKIKKSGKNINLLGTGKPLRQFIYAGDLARIIKEVIDRGITDSFNVANDENYSIDELTRRILISLKKTPQIKYNNPELDGQYRKDVCNKKLKNLIPNFQFTNLEEGISRVYRKYESQI